VAASPIHVETLNSANASGSSDANRELRAVPKQNEVPSAQEVTGLQDFPAERLQEYKLEAEATVKRIQDRQKRAA